MRRSLDRAKLLGLVPRGSQVPPASSFPWWAAVPAAQPVPRGCARQSTLCVTPGPGLPGEKKHSRNMLGSDTPPPRWRWPFSPSRDLMRSHDGVSGLTGPSAGLFYFGFVSPWSSPVPSIRCTWEEVRPHHRSGEAGGDSGAWDGRRFGQHP